MPVDPECRVTDANGPPWAIAVLEGVVWGCAARYLSLDREVRQRLMALAESQDGQEGELDEEAVDEAVNLFLGLANDDD